MQAGLAESLNNTFAWSLGAPAWLCEQIPTTTFEPADPVREWNPWYGAPGYYAEARHIPDQYLDMPYPRVGVNPWDHIFGPFRADDGLQPTRARYIPPQVSNESLI